MIWPQNFKVSTEGFFEVLQDTRFDAQPVSIDIPIYQIDKESGRIVNIYNHPSEIDFLSKAQIRGLVSFDAEIAIISKYELDNISKAQIRGLVSFDGDVETEKYFYLHYMLVAKGKRRPFCNTRNNK